MEYNILSALAKYSSSARNSKFYTYDNEIFGLAELERMSSAIAEYLTNRNTKNKRVGIIGDHEFEFLASIIGAWKAEMSFVPIDDFYPEERIKYICRVAEIGLIIDLRDSGKVENRSLGITDIRELKIGTEYQSYVHKLTGEAYVMFTSGTTGRPKGIPISFENLSEAISWLDSKVFEVKKPKILFSTSYSFDVSLMSWLTAILRQGSLFALSRRDVMNTDRLRLLVKQSDFECVFCTPSFIELLFLNIRFTSSSFPNVKQFVFCGETLSVQLVRLIRACFPNVKIINTYGPTETTIAVTSYLIPNDFEYENVPIGKEREGCSVKVMANGREAHINEVGEIVISGSTVSEGYLQDVSGGFKKNKEFWTGDRGIYDAEGNIVFKGRMDSQIKWKGYRIELAEISICAEMDNKVSSAQAFLTHNSKGRPIRMIIAIIPKEGFSEKTLFRNMRKHLPFYMIPSEVYLVKNFPSNVNGKRDIRGLENEFERKD